MEVLNKQERTKSFLVFLVIFFITVFIIIGAVYFDYFLPWKENKQLEMENAQMKKEFLFQEDFAKKMDELRTNIDSINAPGQDFFYNQQKAIASIISLDQLTKSKDSLQRKDMYDNIIITSKQLVDAKKSIEVMGGGKAEVDSLIKNMETYKAELAKVKRELEVCRQLNKSN